MTKEEMYTTYIINWSTNTSGRAWKVSVWEVTNKGELYNTVQFNYNVPDANQLYVQI